MIFFFRFGGEEFICLLLGTDQRGAIAGAEKLRMAIDQLRIQTGLAPISLTASFGVAGITAEARSIETVLTRADKALYRAKADGWNCIRSS